MFQSGRSDEGGMFRSAASLVPLPGARLERLHLSLNAPVVAVETLPVGPASAAIALHRGPDGTRITLAVRAARGGHVVFFHPDAAWSEREGEDLGVEAALSFAERMGFLFDEDPLERGAEAAEVARLWADFLEEAAPDEGDARAEPAGDRPGRRGHEAGAEEAPPVLLLSKFRFLSCIPAERLLSPPLLEEPVRDDSVLRLLSRF
jgi:hypothetical protein